LVIKIITKDVQRGCSYFAFTETRTVARKSSIGGLLHLCRGACHWNFNENSTDFYCCTFQFRGLGASFGGAKPTKAPSGDRADWNTILFVIFFIQTA